MIINTQITMDKLFFIFLMIFPISLIGQNAQCDENVTPIYGRMGYQPRGQHCEGFYRSLVSAKDIQIVRFTKGNLSYSASNLKILGLVFR